MFVHLHGHSHYSLLEAIGQVGPLIVRAKELGFGVIPVTDYHGMYGIMEFYTKAKKADIKPICGIELTLSSIIGKRPSVDQFITLIAQHIDGYNNLLALTSIANTLGMDEIPTIDIQTLKEHSHGLICLVGSPRSWIGSLILSGQTQAVEQSLQTLQPLFGGQLYLDMTAQSYRLEPTLRPLNDQLIVLSDAFHIPLVVNTNFHYINPEDKIAYEVALAIKDQKLMRDQDRRKVLGDYHIMSEQEVHGILVDNGYSEQQIGQWFATNQVVADSIDLQLPKMTHKFPKYKNPPEIVALYEQFQLMG
ncbi:MAG TPA: PHP domain-containing protein [Candidatus Absconditabacterales bacterium]|nr:PHP domain-containing protein [Candidatus Absconditabacterales bacterium]HNG96970.1 PHP domain-containing protein [Candidatus Absconditabacterales bacterium]